MYNVVQAKSYRKNPVTKQLEGQTELVSQELTHSLGDLAQEGLHKRGVKNNARQRHLFLPHPFFSSCSTLKSPILPVSRNLHCHPPKVPGFFHSFTMNAYRTCHHSWTLPGLITSLCPPWKFQRPLTLNTLLQGSHLPLEFLMVPVEGRKWNRRCGERSQSWDGIWAGVVGGHAMGIFLTSFIGTQPIFLPSVSCKWQSPSILKSHGYVLRLKMCVFWKSTESVPIRGHWRLKANHSK